MEPFETFITENQIETIERRRRNQIFILLQKMKLNIDSIPENWKQHLKFIQHLPTGRNGWKSKCDFLDDKTFYCYASKMFNSLDLDTRNNFTINQFKRMLMT